MTDINTNKDTNTTNNSKSKQELKQEQREKKYEAKLEANKVKELAQLEKKKAKYTVKLNSASSPRMKGHYQEKLDKVEKKIKDLNDPSKAVVKRPFGLVMRTWSKGLGKEAGRVDWYKRRPIIKDFVTVILVCVFLAVIFFAIDMIVIAMRNH